MCRNPSSARSERSASSMIVASNPTQELGEFYPPPYNFLAPQRRPKLYGMGGPTTSGTISSAAGVGGSLVGAGSGLLVAAGVIQGVPVAGQIIGAALAITAVIASMFKGCGSSCTLTTAEVNQVEPYMQQNLAQYLAAPVSAATQQEALANFDQLWQGVVTYCSQPSMAQAGKNCISDRQSGSCAYKTSPGGWQQNNGTWTYQYPGANGSGTACWNWFVGYRDPIANDPRVAAAVASNPVSSVASGITSLLGGGGFDFSSLLLPAAVIGGGLLLASLID
jgi:hypothetical protein